jgi:hypothetical protein
MTGCLYTVMSRRLRTQAAAICAVGPVSTVVLSRTVRHQPPAGADPREAVRARENFDEPVPRAAQTGLPSDIAATNNDFSMSRTGVIATIGELGAKAVICASRANSLVGSCNHAEPLMHAKTTLTRTNVGAAAVEPNQPIRRKASNARRSTAASA